MEKGGPRWLPHMGAIVITRDDPRFMRGCQSLVNEWRASDACVRLDYMGKVEVIARNARGVECLVA